MRRADLRHHATLGIAVAASTAPLVWALASSFKPVNRIYDPVAPPWPVSFDNYRVALTGFPIASLLGNTLLMASAVTAMQLVVAVLAAYGMVRFKVRRAGLLLAALTGALVVPTQSLMVPHFLMLVELGWRNTYAGLVVPQLSGCALAVLLLRQNLLALPPNLFAAAAIDAATPGETLWRVVLPLLRPAMSSVGILVFVATWNEYLWPLLAAPDTDHATIQIGLQSFMNSEGANHGPLLAAAMLSTVPVVAMYLVASRRIVDAFLHSGLR